ncbi:crotonobetainyl-CoA:carnitine CoA-transferase CaiB-like acyl-CoA transferase [Zhongshania antarctica]|uniref:Crotonobetainyl-CoA:carnitine CoA-transferase CaiB-like acyl-CoA transferase n=1 Tax=Zhongshania antarctica TaxID=641702 RepID=A0A840R8S8_9GAMM|nr:hypothetical protein [Zhongshania antarctica]MBB5189004.1 crotonobetainyl-CoA:carnitine CoA-transferase CaiB-like acyl-CoA transferase [Zhongshania antarctica]
MEGSDVCYAPVLDYHEAPKHPHNVARKTDIEFAGQVQPAPAPPIQPHRVRAAATE